MQTQPRPVAVSENKSDGHAGVARRAGFAIAITVVVTALAIFVFGNRAYDWIKAVHVIAVIAWMAGLLYLPRLFIYHCDAPRGSPQSETFKIMERRLLHVIMLPAMVVTWVLGLWLAWQAGWFKAGWLHGKLLAVVLLSACHMKFAAAVRQFEADANEVSQRHWRMWNEVPTVLMVVIVILVVVKPF
jgi:putative membrane protein